MNNRREFLQTIVRGLLFPAGALTLGTAVQAPVLRAAAPGPPALEESVVGAPTFRPVNPSEEFAGFSPGNQSNSLAGAELKIIATRDLPPVSLNGWQVTILELTLPGAPSPRHTHPGFVLGYVLDGNFRFQLQGQPEEILSAGRAFYEPPGAIHVASASANSSTPTRILALSFAEKGKKLTQLL